MTIARLARTAVFPLAALVVGVPVATAGAQAGDLQGYVTRELNGLQARSSIYAKHLASGKTVELRADVPMNTLSVIKIPVMILAFRDAEAGKLKLGERYTIRPEDLRRGSGLLQTFDVGLSPTYRDLIEQMIITSDNTATDIMIRTVGLARVNAMLAELGFRETRLNRTAGDLFREVWIRADAKHASMTDREVYDRGFPSDAESSRRSFTLEGDSTRWLGRTTAREMATMLEGILNAKYASKLSSEVMVGMLRRQFYASRLPQRIQFRASVAHKTGDWPPIAGNDVGIIFYPGGPSIVSVFTNQNTGDFFELESTLGRIAERVIDTWK
ncbi:MAG: serine hydrolase [Gemmatimonadetes bacterium]|jgi:beta-lactamase class A|nr:serine hydrolase [Gemmatimonadota bacterium]